MKLADDALIRIIEIFRQGLMENKDISELLRELELDVSGGKLAISAAPTAAAWNTNAPETD